jgi:hypothetical protein
MGGAHYDSSSSTLYTTDLNHSMIFDTTNGEWSKQNFTGPNYPKPRTMHTATLRKYHDKRVINNVLISL